MQTYDVIVLGVGGMGSATLFELAKRGHKVLGLEQHHPGHNQGSSHGQTRIIRQAYYEHPAYVPLVKRAYERWYDLEQLTGQHLLTQCPCLNAGPPGSELVQGVLRSATQHSLPVEMLSGAEICQRYSAFRFPVDWQGVLEQSSGFLKVEQCVRAYYEEALDHEAEVKSHEPATSWKAVPGGVEVQTAKDTYHAGKLVITAGAWATVLLQQLGLPLKVMRQVQQWFLPFDDSQFRRDRFPIFIAETPNGHYYGLPMINNRGAKIAQHYGAPELTDPSQVNWQSQPDDEPPIRAFLKLYLPGLDSFRSQSRICMYTLTPDKHFVIDVHPEYPQVCFAAGFSGHGFKFASVVGEVLANLCEQGKTYHDISLFRHERFKR